MSTQDAWQAASDAECQIELDDDSLNAHFAYDDEDAHVRHQVWFLDAVTVLNQMRAARALGIQTFALWRLGSEDNSLWKIWDTPLKPTRLKDLAEVEPGYDVDTEGDGDILRVTRKPQNGHRTVTMDDDDSIPLAVPRSSQRRWTPTRCPTPSSSTATTRTRSPSPSTTAPTPTWTPKILDILKQYNVNGTFFMIGEVAAGQRRRHAARLPRRPRDRQPHLHPPGHQRNLQHARSTFSSTSPSASSPPSSACSPLYFRPPYSIDQEPDTNDQAAPVDRIQDLGYVIVGNKIDTNDWDEHPRKTPQEITDSVFQQIADMEAKPWTRGSIILHARWRRRPLSHRRRPARAHRRPARARLRDRSRLAADRQDPRPR